MSPQFIHSGSSNSVGSYVPDDDPENIRAQQKAQHFGSMNDTKPVADPALRLLIEVWSELPGSVKNRILKLADEALRSAVSGR